MKPGIILQARIGSSRFPKKMFGEINGVKLIDIVLSRCKDTGIKTVVAIPEIDRVLHEHLNGNVDVFLGSENDVVSRFYHCAKLYEFNPVIRVCGDSKHVKPELILQQLENYKKYKHTVYGNFCEIFSFKELEWYYYNDKRPETREHVSLGMLQDMTVDYEIDLI